VVVGNTRTLMCAHCDDVIGVYERLIVQLDGEVRETSLAAEGDLPFAAAAHYHEACYAAREHDGSAER
jgi:hypothetical protein